MIQRGVVGFKENGIQKTKRLHVTTLCTLNADGSLNKQFFWKVKLKHTLGLWYEQLPHLPTAIVVIL